jgi:hypothetical protein
VTATPSTPKRTPRPRMAQETMQARAQQRAREQHVHILAVLGRPDCYVTVSKSYPRERYSLVAGPDGIVGCSCKGFEYRQICKHSQALLNRLAREALKTEQAADLLWNAS